MWANRLLASGAMALSLLAGARGADPETPAAPASPANSAPVQAPAGAAVIPEHFLRRWDPVTFFFEKGTGPAAGGPENQPEHFVKSSPAMPGAWTWLDSRTLQFRPAEPWPALSRFDFSAQGRTFRLITLMEPPTQTIPADREEGLDPVERITLTFAEPLDPESLRRMLRIGVRPLPGIDEAQTRWLDEKDFEIKVVERTQRRDPASYVLNFHRPIPSGQRIIVRLRLSSEDAGAQSLRDVTFATSESFRATGLGCGSRALPVTPDGVRYARDQVLTCDEDDRRVHVQFSAALKPLGPVDARNLLRFTPAVEGLTFQSVGRELYADGKFLSDTMYRVSLMPVPLADARGRALQARALSELFLNFPARPRFLHWQLGQGIVERLGPQQLPLEGRGFERVDLRVYPVDPLNRSFWPFPEQPVAVDEQIAPPAPGEEPRPFTNAQRHIDADGLAQHLRTLGSPPVSAILPLPLRGAGSAARFGIDLAPHFAAISGARQPGTYLVGIRQLDGSTQRSWTRVQVTDLSLSTVEEERATRFAVTSLSSGQPVSGAQVRVEGARNSDWITLFEGTTGADGMARWEAPGPGKGAHLAVRRIVVRDGSDVLVLDPTRGPDRYADNHWGGPQGTWLQWMEEPLEGRTEPPQTVCHLFTERPVYRPEEKVYIKGYVRSRQRGALSIFAGEGTVVVEGPGGLSWRYPVRISTEGSFDRVFEEASTPTGPYTIHVELRDGLRRDAGPCGNVSILKEAYRLPEFELRINSPEKVALDREFRVQLTAQYYAGGQATQRPVRWRVTQFPYAWTPRTEPGFYFSSDGRFSGRESFEASPALEREDHTDASGAASLELNPAIEPTAQPRSYIIEATVTGADDQTVTATHRVLALPAIVLGLKTPRFLERARRVSPEVIAVGPDGALLAGQDLTVRLIKREWHSYLRAGDFSQAEAKYVNEVVDRKISERKVRSGEKALAVPLDLDGAGVYLVEVQAQDRLGRAQTVAVDFFAGGDEPVTWSRPPSEVFKVTPDKASYAPGESAHLVLESPFQQAQGLAVIEAPEGNRYQWFTVKAGAATFDVPVAKNFVPRVPVHFVLMRGRVPGVEPSGGGRVDLGKPATVASTSWLTVDPVEHMVNVVLDHPERAKPGDTIGVKIKLTDRGGRPAPGEVTLWLVDQAVLALGKEQRLDPIPSFLTPVRSRLGIEDTRNATLGILPFAEQPGGDTKSKEPGSDLLDRITPRKDFLSVPFYDPHILVGPDGVASVQVKLPDNLTNFRLRAKAASGPDRFGVGVGMISVRLPVIVQPALPRFVRPGDRFAAAAIGRVVEGAGGAGIAEMRGRGVDVEGGGHRALTLAASEPQRIEYQVSVPLAGAGPGVQEKVGFTFALERSADQARDGFDIQLPLRPDRTRLTRRQLLDIAPGQSAEVPALEEEARAGSLQRSILASSQPALVRMAAGLDYLLAYPFQCTEQRVARARAFLAMKAFNERLQQEDPKEIQRVVDETIAWVPGVIDGNGLVSFWPGSTGYVAVTSWVTEFLVEARKAGFTVDAALLDRLTTTLRQALRSDYTHFITYEAYTERVMALRALAAAGKLEPAYLAELARRAGDLNLESSAEVLRLLYLSGDTSGTARDALARRVSEGIIVRLYQGKERYGGLREAGGFRNGLILPSETRTIAEVVRASMAAPSADPRLPLLVDALVTLGQGDGWGSTQANAAALLALADVLKGRPGEDEAQRLVVGPGDRAQAIDLGPANPIARLPIDGTGKLALRSEAKKPLIVRALASYLPKEPGEAAKSGASGFVVSREELHVGATNEPPRRERLQDAGNRIALTVGDVLEDHVEVVTNLDRNQVAVIVPLAAGMEPLNPRLATAPPEARPTGEVTLAPSYVAYLDDQVAFFYDTLPKGTYHFYFRTRATVAGQFTQPQARAELLYDEAVHGESPGARVVIDVRK